MQADFGQRRADPRCQSLTRRVHYHSSIFERLGLAIRVLARRPADPEARHPQFATLRAEIEELPGPRTLDPLGELFAADAREPGLLDLVRELRARPNDGLIAGLFDDDPDLRVDT